MVQRAPAICGGGLPLAVLWFPSLAALRPPTVGPISVRGSTDVPLSAGLPVVGMFGGGPSNFVEGPREVQGSAAWNTLVSLPSPSPSPSPGLQDEVSCIPSIPQLSIVSGSVTAFDTTRPSHLLIVSFSTIHPVPVLALVLVPPLARNARECFLSHQP